MVLKIIQGWIRLEVCRASLTSRTSSFTPRRRRPTGSIIAHPDHQCMALFVESDQFSCLRLDLNTLDAAGFSTKGRKCEQQEGKRQQELAVDMSQRASWDEAWKRYAARVFHNWSKEARGQQASRFVHLRKDRLTAAVG